MDPSSSIPEYIQLFQIKREELTSHFISVLDSEVIVIFIVSLPNHWRKVMINIFICVGTNEDFLTYMYALKVKWEEKIDIEAKIKKYWHLRTCPRPHFYQCSPIDNLANILAHSVINPYHPHNKKDVM
ncbi:hypothetical protein R3W88_024109 [Solanum pinnatisectum]|uniref:Uncharacterized protein n=1 Tax=Solanum pinnatisectum TaxID=50273 RepID=A0AAV9LZM0_9SOLN|nr:hypothetical protein R3W88_024109 [Solanum pinnatisectum]